MQKKGTMRLHQAIWSLGRILVFARSTQKMWPDLAFWEKAYSRAPFQKLLCMASLDPLRDLSGVEADSAPILVFLFGRKHGGGGDKFRLSEGAGGSPCFLHPVAAAARDTLPAPVAAWRAAVFCLVVAWWKCGRLRREEGGKGRLHEEEGQAVCCTIYVG